MHTELVVSIVFLLAVLLAVAWILRRNRALLFGAVTLMACVAFGQWKMTAPRAQAVRDNKAEVLQGTPHLSRTDTSYVSSDRCQACHPQAHHSWHQSFHRTMTQLALPENVVGAFDGSTIESDGLQYRVFQEGNGFWAEMPDPDMMMMAVMRGKPLGNDTYLVHKSKHKPPQRIHLPDIERIKRRVVMTTGSHHYQTYWVESPRYQRVLQTLPLVYLIKDQRWIPREDAFMSAPDEPRLITQWNHHCIKCHSTGGVPGLDEQGMLNTRVAELGIACEACHGPAEKHIRAHEGIVQRYSHRLDDLPDPTIVNPEHLDHQRSSEICGQCHGVFTMNEQYGYEYARNGILYRPGEDLHEKREYIRHPRNDPVFDPEKFARNESFYRQRWWDDGSILAGGREYSAISVSACYTRGEISCLSCHTMHGDDPVDQMKPGMRGSAACLQCHDQPEYTTNVKAHTHHLATSSGSQCMNCHMPHTTYALFGALRSHQIASPSVAASIEHGTPNACNLCHLDQTLEWSQDYMAQWYGVDELPVEDDQREISAALLWMLKGDAAQRVIAAWHTGWLPAREASGGSGRLADDWLAPMTARLLEDPYGVVRYVAHRSLRELKGFNDFEFDFLASPEQLDASVQRAVQTWNQQRQLPLSRHGNAVLVDADGQLLKSEIEQLILSRDNRPVSIRE